MTYVTTTPIVWDQLASHARSSAQAVCGAFVTFVGIVRGDRQGGRVVTALYYEAYPEMAEREIDRLVSAAHAQWALQMVHVQHRLSYVAVGEASVVIIVASAHRTDAYAASQFLIDRIKQVVPIWKQELFDDGTSQWVRNLSEMCSAADSWGVAHAEL